ncbi:gcc2 and gcc3 domain protein, partial [Cystoisospora suis]
MGTGEVPNVSVWFREPTRVLADRSGDTIYAIYPEVNMIILCPLDTKIVYAAATIEDPRGFTLDRTGEYFYLASRKLHRIYRLKFAHKVHQAESVVGNGVAGTGLLTAPNEIIQLNLPNDVFMDEDNVMYISDSGNKRIVIIEEGKARVLDITTDPPPGSPGAPAYALKNPESILVIRRE